MYIKRLIVKNFKNIIYQDFTFDSDMNIIVGNNDSGKSTLFEAIDICLNCSFRGQPLSTIITKDLFNNESVKKFLDIENKNKNTSQLPCILIEAYLDGVSSRYKGTFNSKRIDTTGIKLMINLNRDLEDKLGNILREEKINSLPVEFYNIEWLAFSGMELTETLTPVNNLFIELDRIQSHKEINKYIRKLLTQSTDETIRAELNYKYREIKSKFNNKRDIQKINKIINENRLISKNNLKIVTNSDSVLSWEKDIQLSVNSNDFSFVGKGEQSQILTKITLHNTSYNSSVILVEEPENHLSHINFVTLIDYIEKKCEGKQLFITTHSSYVLNKLNIGKIILFGNKIVRIIELEQDTVKKINKIPGYNTLRVVLCNTVILVEGPSDEIILKKYFKMRCNKLPEQMEIDIIVVGGLNFEPYLSIADAIGRRTIVFKDNDGEYQKNITDWFKKYKDNKNFKISAPVDERLNSLEPSLIDANGKTNKSLDKIANIILKNNRNIKKIYNRTKKIKEKKKILIEYFNGKNNRSKSVRKVEAAINIFDDAQSIEYPKHIKDVIDPLIRSLR